MDNNWSAVALRNLLFPSTEQIQVEPSVIYKQITVKLWGNGVTLRTEVAGNELSSSRWFVARTGQFIMSRIDARHGAFGVVPEYLDGAIVSNDFPLFNADSSKVSPHFLYWLSKTKGFVHICKTASEGTTNRVRLKLDRFLASKILLPPLEDQRRIVAQLEAFADRITEARNLYFDLERENHHLLLSLYYDLVRAAKYLPMAEVAPIVRRPVDVELDESYFELGIRSFGNGTFHKPAIKGLDLGTKRVFWIKPNDLLFSNVFAWEGAIAVVKPEDDGRVGSHRFISCVPKPKVATSSFLCFHFLTPEGLRQIGEASPGGAGRNRTLGLDKLERIQVPVPLYEDQLWFDSVQSSTSASKQLRAEISEEIEALVSSLLDSAFKGDL